MAAKMPIWMPSSKMKVLANPAMGTERRRMARPRATRIPRGIRGRVVRATRIPTRPMSPRVLPEFRRKRVKARVRRARFNVRTRETEPGEGGHPQGPQAQEGGEGVGGEEGEGEEDEA